MSNQIRYTRNEDLEEIKGIIDASFPMFFRYFAWHSVQDSREPTLIKQIDGTTAGFAKLIHFKIGRLRYGCILWIAVHPGFRRRGVASALTQASLEHFRADGTRAVFASTQRRNIGALSTLAKAGFVRVGFLGLWRLFGLGVFGFFRAIWFAPGEVVMMSGSYF